MFLAFNKYVFIKQAYIFRNNFQNLKNIGKLLTDIKTVVDFATKRQNSHLILQ